MPCQECKKETKNGKVCDGCFNKLMDGVFSEEELTEDDEKINIEED